MKRIIFDIIAVLACIFTPWLLAVTLIIVGLLSFAGWKEGIVISLLLDIVMFGGNFGLHTVYVVAGFCALYYVTIRFKELLRIT